jgi:hypothetical protein
MDAFAFVLIVCGGAAVAALALSMTARLKLARRLAKTSLWLALAAVPIAMAIDLFRLWLDGNDPSSTAVLLGKTISHAMNYGVLMLPCAGLAALALRRANARRAR